MTEREAWLELARLFGIKRFQRDRITHNGLCDVILTERLLPGLTGRARGTMQLKAQHEVARLHGDEDAAWISPCTNAGDKVRVAFCKRMARKLARPKRKASR